MKLDPAMLRVPRYVREEIARCREACGATTFKTGLVVDSTNLMYRLAFAASADICGPEDLLAAFSERIGKTVRSVEADAVVCAMDFGVPLRRAMLGAFKKSDKTPEQEAVISTAREALRLLRDGGNRPELNPRWLEGYEADDVAAAFAASGMFVYTVIYSTDSDLYQLTGDTVSQLSPANGIFLKSEVPPELVPGVKALAGDKSDNVEGLKGVGPKTALAVMLGEKELDLSPADLRRVLDNLTLTALPFPGAFRCLEAAPILPFTVAPPITDGEEEQLPF